MQEEDLQEEDLLLVLEVDLGIVAAANAAAMTRSSDGNEQGLRNFTPEKDLYILYVPRSF